MASWCKLVLDGVSPLIAARYSQIWHRAKVQTLHGFNQSIWKSSTEVQQEHRVKVRLSEKDEEYRPRLECVNCQLILQSTFFLVVVVPSNHTSICHPSFFPAHTPLLFFCQQCSCLQTVGGRPKFQNKSLKTATKKSLRAFGLTRFHWCPTQQFIQTNVGQCVAHSGPFSKNKNALCGDIQNQS